MKRIHAAIAFVILIVFLAGCLSMFNNVNYTIDSSDSPDEIPSDLDYKVDVIVSNTESGDGDEETFELYIDDEVVDEKNIQLNGGELKEVTFTHNFAEHGHSPGEYDVTINGDYSVGTVTVTEPIDINTENIVTPETSYSAEVQTDVEGEIVDRVEGETAPVPMEINNEYDVVYDYTENEIHRHGNITALTGDTRDGASVEEWVDTTQKIERIEQEVINEDGEEEIVEIWNVDNTASFATERFEQTPGETATHTIENFDEVTVNDDTTTFTVDMLELASANDDVDLPNVVDTDFFGQPYYTIYDVHVTINNDTKEIEQLSSEVHFVTQNTENFQQTDMVVNHTITYDDMNEPMSIEFPDEDEIDDSPF